MGKVTRKRHTAEFKAGVALVNRPGFAGGSNS
jgi:hypothetical protein